MALVIQNNNIYASPPVWLDTEGIDEQLVNKSIVVGQL